MKGKINTEVAISETESLTAGTEVEIVDIRYGCDMFYMCILPVGRRILINASKIDITDYTPFMEWDKLRVEFAGRAMQGILSSEENTQYSYHKCDYNKNEERSVPKAISRFAVACADALIEELKTTHQTY